MTKVELQKLEQLQNKLAHKTKENSLLIPLYNNLAAGAGLGMVCSLGLSFIYFITGQPLLNITEGYYNLEKIRFCIWVFLFSSVFFTSFLTMIINASEETRIIQLVYQMGRASRGGEIAQLKQKIQESNLVKTEDIEDIDKQQGIKKAQLCIEMVKRIINNEGKLTRDECTRDLNITRQQWKDAKSTLVIAGIIDNNDTLIVTDLNVATIKIVDTINNNL